MEAEGERGYEKLPFKIEKGGKGEREGGGERGVRGRRYRGRVLNIYVWG